MTVSSRTQESFDNNKGENKRRLEVLLVLSLLFHLMWFSGNLYEQILTPNQIVASVEQISNYNNFFSITKPYYYYVPLTQIGTLITIYLAFFSGLRTELTRARFAALASISAFLLTIFIVTQYNLNIFLSDVSHLSDSISQLHIEWAVLNGIRIVLVGMAIIFLFRVYRRFIKECVTL